MKPHRFDPLSFLAGGGFLALGLVFLLAGADVADDASWVWPLLLLGLGAAGLVSALRRDEEPEG